MKITYSKIYSKISFEDLDKGDIYYDENDILCMKIAEIPNYNTIVIEEMILSWEKSNALVTPVDSELIIR